MHTARRVVITGLGMVSPLANGYEESWKRLLQGHSGAGPIDRFDASDLACQVACQLPFSNGEGGGSAEDPHSFDPSAICSARERRRFDDFILYAIAAAREAVADSGWVPQSETERQRAGVMVGSGIGGLNSIANTALLMEKNGPRRVSPFFIPGALINLASGHISIEHGYKGPNHASATACASGAHAIGDSMRLIQSGAADLMLAGGTEGAICRLGIAAFCACKALSTGYNDRPQAASRPFDAGRDGFVMGEGAAILVLEELEHAQKRGANILAEIIGYGLSGDAYHITAPDTSGDGGERAMRMALTDAKTPPEAIDYVNAHGTSTPAGDEIELRAIERILGDHAKNISLSSTKSATGHLLGAAGAIEAGFSVLALRDQIVPATLNLDTPSIETVIDLTPHTPKKRKIETILTNSFGFGGTNAVLIVKAFT